MRLFSLLILHRQTMATEKEDCTTSDLCLISPTLVLSLPSGPRGHGLNALGAQAQVVPAVGLDQW